MTDFDTAFQIVIGVEGGYQSPAQAVANNDPGGETKYGICKRDNPTLDIANLTLDQAKQIYSDRYWAVVKGNQLPYPLNVFVFDSAVNQGSDAAIKLLQKALNVAQDGILGINTMALASKPSQEAAALFMAARALRYTGTRNFDVFGTGWFKRLFVVTAQAYSTGDQS